MSPSSAPALAGSARVLFSPLFVPASLLFVPASAVFSSPKPTFRGFAASPRVFVVNLRGPRPALARCGSPHGLLSLADRRNPGFFVLPACRYGFFLSLAIVFLQALPRPHGGKRVAGQGFCLFAPCCRSSSRWRVFTASLGGFSCVADVFHALFQRVLLSARSKKTAKTDFFTLQNPHFRAWSESQGADVQEYSGGPTALRIPGFLRENG